LCVFDLLYLLGQLRRVPDDGNDELVALVIEVLFEDFGRSILNFDDEAATIVYVYALPSAAAPPPPYPV
jgi:hypothetical protein